MDLSPPTLVTAACDRLSFPSLAHREAVFARALELAQKRGVLAVCLVASLARGVGDKYSDLDLAVYAPTSDLPRLQAEIEAEGSTYRGFWCDVEVTDGMFVPGAIGWTSMDEFELAIGNLVAYAVPLYDPQNWFAGLRARYLPYYDEALAHARQHRFHEVTLNHAARMRTKVERGLLFGAAERLRGGVQSLLAGIFVARRVYPVSYAKWLEQQLVELLGLPELHSPLRRLFDLGELDPDRILQRADELEALANEWIPLSRSRDGSRMLGRT